MKRLIIVFPFLLFTINYGLNAQKTNVGVYLSADDFTSGKISFAHNQDNKYKIHLHELFNTSIIKIINGGSVVRLDKDSIFGYRDKKNTCYRFFNKIKYKIINPSENILLYSRPQLAGGPKNSHTVTAYYFSVTAGSPVYPLSKRNLKSVLYDNVLFNEMLDVYFHDDAELITFDDTNKIYDLNRIYDLSKRITVKTNNN